MLDVHSHILPGLDDGTKTPQESLEAMTGLAELGFTDLVCTPHYYPGRYTPSVESIQQALKTMQEMTQGLNVNFILGRECFLDPQLLTAPERDTFSFNWKNLRFQLIELPSITVPQVTQSYVQLLKQSSIFPILAHPERYNAIVKEPKSAKVYRDMGFRLQIDLANLSSSAHRSVRKAAREMFSLDLVDLVASDLHHPFQLEAVREGLEFVRHEYGQEALDRYVSLP